jgi:hypothetical protein
VCVGPSLSHLLYMERIKQRAHIPTKEQRRIQVLLTACNQA